MTSTAARTISETTTAEDAQPLLRLAQPEAQDTLRNCVRRSLTEYFANLEGESVQDLYQVVLAEIEIPLLEKVLEHTRGNQTQAAEILGLNRGTLRKKLKQYGLL